MNELTTQILARVDALGAKIGVASGQVYSALLTQARVQGVEDLIGCGVFLVGAGLSGRLAYALIQKFRAEAYGEDYRVQGILLSAVSAGCLALAILQFGNDAITELFNPQYWALREIAQFLGK